MALSLIAGPPNSGRAGEIRKLLTEALPTEPVLVVPTAEDVTRFERELCEGAGAVIGGSVRTFEWLFADVADAVGSNSGRPAPPLTAVQRRRAIELAARDCADGRTRALSARPGFVDALAEAIEDLQAGGVEPEALERAADELPGAEHLRGVAAAYTSYAALRDRLGRSDRHGLAREAIAGLRARPDAWGGRPVLIYGFDDLSEEQLALVEALAKATAVTAAVTYEDERAPLAARATLLARLGEIAGSEPLRLPPNAEHTASPVLYALERGLFEDEPRRAEPDGGLVFMESAGERAEAESIGAELARLIAEGAEPDSIAVALRPAQRLGPLYAGVFERFGIPASVHADLPLAETGVGAGLLALLRAVEHGEARDLVAYLRAPGRAFVDQADWLERHVRCRRLRTLEEALEVWSTGSGRDLDELAEIRDAPSPAAACLAVAGVARRMTGGAHRRSAPLLEGPDALEARAAQLAAAAAGELAEIAELAPSLPELRAALEALTVPLAGGRAEGRVQVTSPYRLRAGRFAHVFVASLQEGEFPGAEPRPGLLSDDERAAVGLPERADPEAEERYLFYVCVSRPTDRLHLSWRIAGEDGSAEAPSPFVEEVREVLDPPPPRAPGEPDPLLARLTRTRGPGRVVLEADEAPSMAELGRSLAATGAGRDHLPAMAELGVEAANATALAVDLHAAATRLEPPENLSHPLVLASLADRPPFGASTLENYAVCSYAWFVDHELSPRPLDPRPEPLDQGTVIHETLERLYREPPDAEGVPRPATLAAWQEHAGTLLRKIAEEHGLGPHDAGRRAGLERMHTLLRAFLAREASRDWALRPDPELLEAKFGHDTDAGPLDLGGFQMRGSIDRVDVGTDRDGRRIGLVRDYKLARKAVAPKKFEDEGRLQLQLYMLALRRLFDVEPIGGLYEPLGSEGREKPRGPVLAEARDEYLDRGSVVQTDLRDREGFEEMLDTAQAKATKVVGEMRAGLVTRNPIGGVCPRFCTFQPICRRERAPLAEREESRNGESEDEG
jgi:ATP-dependent helicase/nuclease subunit B